MWIKCGFWKFLKSYLIWNPNTFLMSTASTTRDFSTLYTTILYNKLKTKFFLPYRQLLRQQKLKMEIFILLDIVFVSRFVRGPGGGCLQVSCCCWGFGDRFWGGAFCKFCGRYNSLICPYNLSLSQMLSEMFRENFWAVFEHWFWLQIALFVMLARGGCVRTEGVLTPLWHLAPLLVCPGVHVYRALIFVLLFFWGGDLRGWLYSLSLSFHGFDLYITFCLHRECSMLLGARTHNNVTKRSIEPCVL